MPTCHFCSLLALIVEAGLTNKFVGIVRGICMLDVIAWHASSQAEVLTAQHYDLTLIWLLHGDKIKGLNTLHSLQTQSQSSNHSDHRHWACKSACL